MGLTLNQIVKRIKDLSLNHAQIKTFYRGDVTDFLTEKTTRYPGAFLQDTTGTIGVVEKTTTINFRMFFLDIVHAVDDSLENELDVQSDMLSIAQDIIALMDSSEFMDWKVSSAPVTLVREQLDDLVAGVTVDLSISVMFEKDTCAVPVIPAQAETTIEWGIFADDPYVGIEEAEFQFQKPIMTSSASYVVDFTDQATGNYIAIKEPSTEPEKEEWFNSELNYGVFPDQLFRAPVIIAGSRYYVTRKPAVISADKTTITINV